MLNSPDLFSDFRRNIQAFGTPWWISDLLTVADEVRDRTIFLKIKSQLHSWTDLEIKYLFSEFGMIEEVTYLPKVSGFHSRVRFQTIYDSEWAYYYYGDGKFAHHGCCEIEMHRADDAIRWNAEKETSDLIAHQVLEEMPKSIVTHEVKFLDEIGKKIDELVDGFDLKAPPIGSVERLDDAGEEKELIQVEGSEPVAVKEISDFTAHQVLEEMSQSTETIEVNLTGVLTKDDEDDDDLLEMASWIEEDFEPPTYTKSYMRLMCFDPGGSELKSNDHVVSELGLMIHVIQFGVEINETRHQIMKMKDQHQHVIIVAAKLGVVVMDVQRAAPFTLGFDPACLSSAAYMFDMIIRLGMASVTAPFLIFIFDPGAESMEQEYKSDIFGERGILLSAVHGIVEDGNFIEDSKGKISMPSYLSDFNVAPSSSDAEAGNVLPSGTPYPPNPMKMKMLQLSNTSSGDNNHFTGWKIQGEDEQDFPAGDLTEHDFTDSFMGGFSYMQDPSVVLDQGIAAEISVPSDLASFNETNISEAEIVKFPSNLPAQKVRMVDYIVVVCFNVLVFDPGGSWFLHIELKVTIARLTFDPGGLISDFLEDKLLALDHNSSNFVLTFLNLQLVGVSVTQKEAWTLPVKAYLTIGWNLMCTVVILSKLQVFLQKIIKGAMLLFDPWGQGSSQGGSIVTGF